MKKVRKKPLSSKEFKDIYCKTTRLCVDLLIKTPKGLVLTLRQIEPYKGQWHFPGGTVFFKEKIEHAVQRVAVEEIGVPVRIRKLLGYIEFPSEEKERGFGYSVSLAFLCSLEDVEMSPNDEASAIKIFKEPPSGMISEQKEFLKSIWSTLNI